MNLHEYQSKQLLHQFKLPLLNGRSYIKKLDGLESHLKDLSGPPWIVKSQIHAGGRGAGHFKNDFNQRGGVQVISGKLEVLSVASSMIGNILITKQTGPEGKKVNRIFVEEGCNIDREFYLSLLIDRNNSQLHQLCNQTLSKKIYFSYEYSSFLLFLHLSHVKGSRLKVH